jgi:hypothetical protein
MAFCGHGMDHTQLGCPGPRLYMRGPNMALAGRDLYLPSSGLSMTYDSYGLAVISTCLGQGCPWPMIAMGWAGLSTAWSG